MFCRFQKCIHLSDNFILRSCILQKTFFLRFGTTHIAAVFRSNPTFSFHCGTVSRQRRVQLRSGRSRPAAAFPIRLLGFSDQKRQCKRSIPAFSVHLRRIVFTIWKIIFVKYFKSMKVENDFD